MQRCTCLDAHLLLLPLLLLLLLLLLPRLLLLLHLLPVLLVAVLLLPLHQLESNSEQMAARKPNRGAPFALLLLGAPLVGPHPGEGPPLQ